MELFCNKFNEFLIKKEVKEEENIYIQRNCTKNKLNLKFYVNFYWKIARQKLYVKLNHCLFALYLKGHQNNKMFYENFKRKKV